MVVARSNWRRIVVVTTALFCVIGCSGRALLDVGTPRRTGSIESADNQQVAQVSGGGGLRKSFVKSSQSRTSHNARESKARRFYTLDFVVVALTTVQW